MRDLPELRPPMWQGPVEQDKGLLGPLVHSEAAGQHEMPETSMGECQDDCWKPGLNESMSDSKV